MKADVNDVRKEVFKHRGSKVKVRSNKGRHKFDIVEGVIKEVYPYIFMVEIQDEIDDCLKTVSYSYTDVITRDVQLTLCC